jgi:hypothetical protein
MARRRKPAKKGKGFGLEKMSDEIRDAAFTALRNAAKEVVNDLAAIGPAWGGDFRDSWYVETADGKRGARPGGKDGKYNLFNIPLLKTQGRNAKGQFTSSLPASGSKIELLIGNSSPYAQEAMDLIPGRFIRQEEDPIKAPVAIGRRVGKYRGDVKEMSTDAIAESGKRPAMSTAEKDWYSTYMEGGKFKAAIKKGAKAGFLIPVNKK